MFLILGSCTLYSSKNWNWNCFINNNLSNESSFIMETHFEDFSLHFGNDVIVYAVPNKHNHFFLKSNSIFFVYFLASIATSVRCPGSNYDYFFLIRSSNPIEYNKTFYVQISSFFYHMLSLIPNSKFYLHL